MGRLTWLLTWQPIGRLSSWTQFTSALKFCNRIYEEVITSLFAVLFYRWILFSAVCYRWIPSATVRVCVRVCDRLVTCSWGINKWACTLLNWSAVVDRARNTRRAVVRRTAGHTRPGTVWITRPELQSTVYMLRNTSTGSAALAL